MDITLIKKSSGALVPFSSEKLENSLFRSGASQELIKQITLAILRLPTENLTTKDVYKHAFQLLRKSSYQLAARYKLQKAILELGPSGYPFEAYVSHLFAFQGLDTSVGVAMNGKRIIHEVDIWAKNHNVQYIVECKHHGNQSYKSDIKVVLYVHARFNDIVSQLKKHQKPERQYKCWIVTNTRFTDDAISYASGENIELMAWNYPSKGSLRERIDISGLYPITCLCSLTKSEKQHLLDQKIVLCKQLLDNPEQLNFIRSNKTTKVINECRSLVKGS